MCHKHKLHQNTVHKSHISKHHYTLNMFHFSEQVPSTLNSQFEQSVKNLIVTSGDSINTKVCVTCDCFLDYNESEKIFVTELLKMRKHLIGKPGIFSSLKEYYTAPDCTELQALLLSPRATFVPVLLLS